MWAHRGMAAAGSGEMPGTSELPVSTLECSKTDAEEHHQERVQMFNSLENPIKDMQKEHDNANDSKLSFKTSTKSKDASKTLKEAQSISEEMLKKDEELERLKEEYAQLVERKQELEEEKQRSNVNWYLEKFKDWESPAENCKRRLYFRQTLFKRQTEGQEQTDQLRRALVLMEDEHYFSQLKHNNELFELQSQLNELMSQTLIWERIWDEVREKYAKKTLHLALFCFGVQNLYEMAGGNLKKDGISIADTEKQLDRIKSLFQEHERTLCLYQNFLETDSDEEEAEGRRTPDRSSPESL